MPMQLGLQLFDLTGLLLYALRQWHPSLARRAPVDPFNSIESYDGIRLTLPSLAEGQTSRPVSNLLVNRQAPDCPTR